MSIPSEIQSLIDRLNLELEIIEREAIEGEAIEGENPCPTINVFFPQQCFADSVLCVLANYSIFCSQRQKTDRRS
ncbi:MAG: hypothetical protein AAF298_02345 [Cyanobacteria bacterium P01_A01_bin.40]